ncbi:YceI family protein [Bacteroidota bacterium]
MKTIINFVLFLLIIYSSAFAQNKWTVDPVHSNIGFSISHLTISEVSGSFNTYTIDVIADEDDFTNSQITFTGDVNSVNTGIEKRDDHLRSADFFDAENYPYMTFVSKSLEKVRGDKYKLVGDFTIKDITKEVELDVVYNGMVKDLQGITRAGFKVSGEFNRFDFGIIWNNFLETGGLIVGKTVYLDMDLELVKQ